MLTVRASTPGIGRAGDAYAPSRYLALFLALLGTSLSATTAAAHTVDVCSEPPAGSWLSLAYYDQRSAALEGSGGTTNRDDYGIDLLVDLGRGWRLGGGYRGTALHVSRLPLQTNGYLHTLYFPVQRVTEFESGSLRIGVAPAVATSSNVFSDPGRYTHEDFQLPAAFVWSRQVSGQHTMSVGVCADRRFGEHRVYPVLLADWRIGPRWRLELGFPESGLTFAPSGRISLRLRIGPNGHAWRVRNRSLTKRSTLVYEADRLDASIEWRAGEHLRIGAIVGVDMRARYEMPLADDRRERYATDAPGHIGVRIAWQF